MNYLRIAIVATLAAICILGIMAICTFDYSSTRSETCFVYEQFLLGNSEIADANLRKIKTLSPAEYWLYKAYISRQQHDLSQSSFYLKKALKDEVKDSKGFIELEIHLNQLLNAYLGEDEKALQNLLEQIRKKTGENYPWVYFFSAVNAYFREDYKIALENLQKSQNKAFLSPWMKKAFEDVFSPNWLFIFQTHCEIEEGRILSLKDSLESQKEQASGEFLEDIEFLLGLLYFQQAKENSPQAQLIPYQLAFDCLSRVPIHQERFSRRRTLMIKKLHNETLNLVKNKLFQELDLFVKVLENWHAGHELDQLTGSLVDMLNLNVPSSADESVQGLQLLLDHRFTQDSLRQALCKQLEKLFQGALQAEDFLNVKKYWEIIRQLSVDFDQLAEHYADNIAEKAVQIIQRDDVILSASKPYFDFWEEVEKNHQKRYQFAEQLLFISGRLWQLNQEEKAISLMKVAKSMPYLTDQKMFHDRIEKKIHDIYRIALQNDQVDQFFYILEAVRSFNLTTVDIGDKKETANQLEDAQYLFEKLRYRNALEKVVWILQIDPQNQKAKRIAGLIAYQEGRYAKAYSYLNTLQELDAYSSEALAVCRIIFEASDESRKDPLSQEAYLHLGFGFLMKNQPIESLRWFDKIVLPNQEAIVGLLLANFEAKNWEKVLEGFNQLSYPSNTIEEFWGMAIESCVAMGKIELAEEFVRNLLDIQPLPQDEYSILLWSYKRIKLDSYNRYYVVGKFFRDVKKDKEKALKYFGYVSDPSIDVLLDRADLLLLSKHYPLALHDLFSALEKSSGSLLQSQIIKQAYLLLGKVYDRLGQYEDSEKYFREYFEFEPDQINDRFEFINVLMCTRRFDLALHQILLLERFRPLSFDEKIAYFSCLLHLDHFDRVNKESRDWLNQNPSIPLVYQLKVAHLLMMTRSPDLFKEIEEKISQDYSILTLEEKMMIIQLWIDVEDYSKAAIIADGVKLDLQNHSQGLMLLALLEMQFSHPEKAFQYAQRALKLTPNASDVLEFIHTHQNKADYLEENIRIIEHRLEESGPSLSLQIGYSKLLIEKAIEDVIKQKISHIAQSKDLEKAHRILNKVSQQNQEFPEIFFLLGQALYLFDNDYAAELAFLSAIRLDISYSAVYKRLVKVYEHRQDFKNAEAAALLALKYEPNDVETWQLLQQIRSPKP